ncbi:MAG: acyl-CoA dehydrogenase [Pseudomonadota bacterium]
MPYDLTPDALQAVDAARAFAPEAARRAAAAEAARAPDPGLIPAAAEAGLTGMQIPRDLGGAGLPFAARAAVAEALAGACYGVAMAVVNTHNCALRLARLAPRDMAERLVPALVRGTLVGCTAMTEPAAGSDFAALETTARRDARDGLAAPDAPWRLDGAKAWIVNARLADLAVVFAQTGAVGDGKGIAGFLVETARPGAARTARGMGALQAMGLGGLALDGYAAPPEALLLPPGPGFRRAMEEINPARVHVAAMACGLLRAALDAARAHGAHRRSFGRPLAEHQGWRWIPAQAEADLFAARLAVAEAARLIDAGDAADAEPDAGAAARDHAAQTQLAAASAKIVATEAAARHVPALVHALGAEGLAEDAPLARHLVAVRAARLADGSTEMLLERIARLAAP